MTEDELKAIEARYPNDEVHQLTNALRELQKARDFSDAPIYEVEGAIRNAATDLAVAANARADAASREQTAATILAALIDDNSMSALTRWEGDRPIIERLGSTDARMVAYAVALTDALRAELSKGRP